MAIVHQIKIADTQFAHGTSLGSGDLKLKPRFIEWYRGKEYRSDAIFVTESCFHLIDNYTEPIKIAWLLEPKSISPSPYEWIRNPVNYKKFSLILSHNKELLTWFKDQPDAPPAEWYPFGGCWIYPDDRKIYEKTKLVSIIASPKKTTEGHLLRHQAIERFSDRIDGVFNSSTYLGPQKINALKEYAYSIVIENERSDDFFTEKIIDCFVTGTIPIYWGCRNIGNYFDRLGFHIFNDLDELGWLLDTISIKSYNNRLGEMAILSNMTTADEKYSCTEDWLWQNEKISSIILPW